MQEKLYSLRECAQKVGCRYDRLRWWVTNNELPCEYVGSHPTFTEAQMEQAKAFWQQPKKKIVPFTGKPQPEILSEKSGVVAIGVAADVLGLTALYVKNHFRELGLTPNYTPGGHLRFNVAELRKVAQDLIK
jgi:hypothetical protein